MLEDYYVKPSTIGLAILNETLARAQNHLIF